MIRLMCSNDRQEVETLKSSLFQAGIRAEIQSNPLAHAMGITRLEIFVLEQDLARASKVRQRVESAGGAEEAAGSRRNGDGERQEWELVLDAEPPVPPIILAPVLETSGHPSQPAATEPEGEFAQATALLAREVEELMVREGQLVNRCGALEEKVTALEQTLAQARADLAREVANFADAEKRLAEVGTVRASLDNDLRTLEVRFKASEQALAAAQARQESHAREVKAHLVRIADLTKEVSARDAQLESVAESLAAARAGMEQEKSLRLGAEQMSGELAAAQKALEHQLAQQSQQRQQLLSERQGEHDQLRACVGKVNDLRSRLRAKLAAKDK